MISSMNIITDDTFTEPTLQFLKRCYKFVMFEWQHASRELLPDQGFERCFRESCIINLKEWNISQERELHLGYGLETASGVYHEVDIVAIHPELTAILEIKKRQGYLPDKNDVIVFFAKILDYLALNPNLLLKELCPVFMSNINFEESGLSACLGLGIHPVAPELRPLPILVNTARIMSVELQRNIAIKPKVFERFQDLCAQINRLSCILSETWLSNRCGYQSEDKIVLKAVGGLQTNALSQELRQINSDCSELLAEFRRANSRT